MSITRSLGCVAVAALAIGNAGVALAYELTPAYGFTATELDADEVCAAEDLAFVLEDERLGTVEFYTICNAYLAVHADQVFNLSMHDSIAFWEHFERGAVLTECTSAEGWEVELLTEPDGNRVELRTPCAMLW